MFETEAELDEIQAMFDAHLAHANKHMTNIVKPERRPTARQVAGYLQGTKHVAFATVTSKGEPRASPLDMLFIHGRFTLGTGGGATKVQHLRANPACSAVHVDGDRIAVVVNGRVEWIPREHPDHDEILQDLERDVRVGSVQLGRRLGLLPHSADVDVGVRHAPGGVPRVGGAVDRMARDGAPIPCSNI